MPVTIETENILFIGGPIDGQKLNIKTTIYEYYVPRLNKSGRMMIAVYHRDEDKNCFKFHRYTDGSKVWRDN